MLDIKYRFTCGDSELSEIIERCQNIVTRIVVKKYIVILKIVQLSLKLISHFDKDLKSLRIKNLNKIIVTYLNINFIRNNFEFLAHQVPGNIDMLMISETKFDESFLPSQFLLDGYRSGREIVAFYYLSERTYHQNFHH